MSRQHRTLQQLFTKLCLSWLSRLATYEPQQYDLRNEASVKAAKAINENIDPDLFSMPFI